MRRFLHRHPRPALITGTWTTVLLLAGAVTPIAEGQSQALANQAPAAQAQPGDPATGWHGEPLPRGLIRSEVEGEYLWQSDGSIMVFVPPGPFKMGHDHGDPDEQPVHEVWLDGFYIDKYETTWRQWRLSGLPLPVDINGLPIRPAKPIWGRGDRMPVSYIKWTDAKRYVAWAGKRLPTEAEWEKAARGTDERIYPWGNEAPSFERAVWREHPIGKDEPTPVDASPEGVSPYGAYNMAGNVYEWTEDVYDRAFYAQGPEQGAWRNPRNDGPGDKRVLRGGSFVFDASSLRAPLRYPQWPREGQDYVGFRAALSAAPTAQSPAH